MEINKLLSICDINLPYNIYTTNDFIISQAPYIDTCEELETFIGSKTADNIVENLENQNFEFLMEHFKNKKNDTDKTNKISDDVLDNMLLGMLVIIAIMLFIFVMPNGF